MYCELRVLELYTGTGYTDLEKTIQEYILVNKPIKEFSSSFIMSLDVILPEENKQG